MHKLANKCVPPTVAGRTFLRYVRKGMLPPGVHAPQEVNNTPAEWYASVSGALVATDKRMSRADELRLRTFAAEYANLVSIGTPREADHPLSNTLEDPEDSLDEHDSNDHVSLYSMNTNEESSGSD